jgi:dolichol-phosphate mannosyltransferase
MITSPPADFTIVVPTYNERDRIGTLLERVFEACDGQGIAVEVVIVDDNSADGTGALADQWARERRVRVIHRAGKLGLGTAVLEGFAIAQTEIVGVMDGDLSHPPELLPRLFRTIADGAFDLVVASRYVPGGGTSNFPLGRWLLSRAGCWLARPLTPVRDAMSGFFLIRRTHLDEFHTSVKGFKIGLEVFVRSQARRLAEVGYVFVGRSAGESKMSVAEGTGFLRQLTTLYRDARRLAPVSRPACVTIPTGQERAASASLSGA